MRKTNRLISAIIFSTCFGVTSVSHAVVKEFQQLDCQVMNPFAHSDYAVVSSLKVKRQDSGKDLLLAHSAGLKTQAIEGQLRQSDSWIYGAWGKGSTWLSLAKGKLNKAPLSKWIGAIVFKNKYDFEIACTQL